MVEYCEICHEEVKEDSHYYKKHKLKIEAYFRKYFPKRDLLTNENIPFKNKEQYLATDFINKDNLKKYLSSVTVDAARAYCKNLLTVRKEKKGLIYSPCQVELRSTLSPSIITYNRLFGDYYKLCESLDLKNKHCNADFLPKEPVDYHVTVDTRESIPLKFDDRPRCVEIKIEKMDFGDYCLKDCFKYSSYFERKSATDFISTLSNGYERFCRELVRARESKEYLTIVVEETLDNLLDFKKLSSVYSKTRISPEYVFHNVRAICQEFPEVQFAFVKDRCAAVQLMERIHFSMNMNESFDLQYLIDQGKL